MLHQVWTALSGVSGIALACCLLAAAAVLRWAGRRTARRAAARARQRQRAGLETMDKAVQRFRLQVTAGAPAGVGGRGEHQSGQGSTFSRLDARRPTGEQRRCEPGNRTPPWANALRTLSAPGAARGKTVKKGTGQVMESGRCFGVKRSFTAHHKNLDYRLLTCNKR